jgi:hypothetical protein
VLSGDAIDRSITFVLAGDAAAARDLKACSQDQLLAAQARLGPLLLTRSAVRRVIDALRTAAITPEVAQEWASFVRRGYIAQAVAAPVRPLEIEFDPTDEDKIADSVARLDEIGDVVDGEIDAAELTELTRQLDQS